jgi:hypothetical protein
LEAASRGAAEVLLVEQDAAWRGSCRCSRRGWAPAVQLRRGDGVAALAGAGAGQRRPGAARSAVRRPALFAPALQAAARAVRPTGFVYLEAPERWGDAALAAAGLACTGI